LASNPDRVILSGISGGMNNRLQVGLAYWFSEVAAYGIGAGAGDQFLTAGEMDWPHWAAPDQPEGKNIGDVIELTPTDCPAESHGGLLVTACAASAHPLDVNLRLKKFPSAAGEDMEGFSVALAGKLCGVPVEIVRGVSNHAGDRSKQNWKIQEALAAAAELLIERLA
jgi:futalosine hydrolase